METVDFAGAAVSRVIEWAGAIKTVAEILPDSNAADWQANRELMAPDFWDPRTDAYLCHIQTWVVKIGSRTILVDTGVGNDRDRPQIPPFAHLQTDFLERLASAGVHPDDVDIVINTHIHYDHVGWNTALVDGDFKPTFPNATYLVPRLDYDYFHPANAGNMRAPETEDERRRFDGIRLVFSDSITPIEQAGQLQLWQDRYDLPGLPMSIEPAPGHTPGSSVVHLNAGRGAVFVGDLLHSPMQILRPDYRCSFDLDAAEARRSRRRILAKAAADGSVILPAHLPGHSGAAIAPAAEQRADTGFVIESWAGFPRTSGS